MIVLNVTYKCRAGRREEYREIIRSEGIDAASRSEEGNFKYDFYYSTENPDDVLLVEFWKNDEALDAHRQQPHFAKLGEIQKDFVEEKTIKKYFTEDQ